MLNAHLCSYYLSIPYIYIFEFYIQFVIIFTLVKIRYVILFLRYRSGNFNIYILILKIISEPIRDIQFSQAKIIRRIGNSQIVKKNIQGV